MSCYVTASLAGANDLYYSATSDSDVGHLIWSSDRSLIILRVITVACFTVAYSAYCHIRCFSCKNDLKIGLSLSRSEQRAHLVQHPVFHHAQQDVGQKANKPTLPLSSWLSEVHCLWIGRFCLANPSGFYAFTRDSQQISTLSLHPWEPKTCFLKQDKWKLRFSESCILGLTVPSASLKGQVASKITMCHSLDSCLLWLLLPFLLSGLPVLWIKITPTQKTSTQQSFREQWGPVFFWSIASSLILGASIFICLGWISLDAYCSFELFQMLLRIKTDLKSRGSSFGNTVPLDEFGFLLFSWLKWPACMPENQILSASALVAYSILSGCNFAASSEESWEV